MTIKEIRDKIINFPKYPGTKNFPNAPVIHEGFPSCFNLSLAEFEIIKEFNGQYLHYDHDFIYSKIQPCIRHQDWKTIENNDTHRYRYLSLFDMADVSGLIIKKNNSDQDELSKFSIKSFLEFIESVGLKKENLRISYFSGDTVRNATEGKYEIDKEVREDPMKSYWVSLGIKEDQLISDKTRDTFLALNIFGLPTPWGYRNEINYLHQGKLLDIGTVEYMKFQPIFSGDKIVDIESFEHALSVSAVGIERISMAVNGFENIWQIDTVWPLVEKIMDASKNKNEIQAMISVQALRSIHRIVTDGGEYKNLNKRRKEYIRMFYKALLSNFKKLEIDLTNNFLVDLLNDNAELQSYYPEMKKSIEKTIREINLRNEAFENDKSVKGM